MNRTHNFVIASIPQGCAAISSVLSLNSGTAPGALEVGSIQKKLIERGTYLKELPEE